MVEWRAAFSAGGSQYARGIDGNSGCRSRDAGGPRVWISGRVGQWDSDAGAFRVLSEAVARRAMDDARCGGLYDDRRFRDSGSGRVAAFALSLQGVGNGAGEHRGGTEREAVCI